MRMSYSLNSVMQCVEGKMGIEDVRLLVTKFGRVTGVFNVPV